MKTLGFVVWLLLVPTWVGAQEQGAEQEPTEELVPSNLAAVELARSRQCVPALARLDALNRDLDPLAARGNRLAVLDRAVRLEDSTQVAPFDATDSVEVAVQEWFVEDGELGRRWAETGDSAVAARRDELRATVRRRLVDAMQEVNARAQARMDEAGDLQEAATLCDGAILVRSAVMEVCDTVQSPVCAAAADTSASGPLRFADNPADIWDVQQFRAWSDPGPLQIVPPGRIGGARTMVRARRGNVVVVAGLEPMIRERSDLSEEQVAEFEANLDSLDFTFANPRFVMAPALEIQVNVPEPLGGETHYMLHFGDLSDPPNQVVWTGPATQGPVQAVFPAAPGALARLQEGEALNLTAVTVKQGADGGQEATPVWTVPLGAVGQSKAVSALLGYMAGGGFAQDLARVTPPDTTATGG